MIIFHLITIYVFVKTLSTSFICYFRATLYPALSSLYPRYDFLHLHRFESAERFICIADGSKLVNILGDFPLPVEVIPMARSYVARELVKLGADPVYRQGVVTDNGNIILDVHNLTILDPVALEKSINALPGVVTVGLFAARGADIALIGTPDGVKTIEK